MTEIEVMSLFCEDVRWESNGSPMIMGVMAPVFHAASYPIEFGELTLVTFFRCSKDVGSFQAELFLEKITGEDEENIGAFDGNFAKGEEDSSKYQWVAVSTLSVADLEMKLGDTLRATVSIADESWSVYLTAGSPID